MVTLVKNGAPFDTEHRAEKWPPVFRKAMRKQKTRASQAMPTSRSLL
ncbi:hypothetical protein [Caulobacter sp. LARHSG274]